MSRGLDPFEDVDRADAEAYSVGYTNVEIYGYLCAVHSQLGGRLNVSSHFMFVMRSRSWEFALEFGVDWQFSAP